MAESHGLDALRAEIDLADRAILEALARRRAVVERVRGLKRAQGLPPLDPQREQRVRDRWAQHAAELGIPTRSALEILEAILVDSRARVG